jgi:hypothetical protein
MGGGGGRTRETNLFSYVYNKFGPLAERGDNRLFIILKNLNMFFLLCLLYVYNNRGYLQRRKLHLFNELYTKCADRPLGYSDIVRKL